MKIYPKIGFLLILLINISVYAQQSRSNPPGSISQTINEMEISYFAIEGVGTGNVTIVLKLENKNTVNPIAFAAKEEGSSGPADFYRFFPANPAARLTDNYGREYRPIRSSGFGFARGKDDWTIVNSRGSTPASITFSGPSGGLAYNFNTEIRLVWGENGRPKVGTFQIYFPNLTK